MLLSHVKHQAAIVLRIFPSLLLVFVILASCDNSDSPNGPEVGNRAPFLAPIGDRTATEGINLIITITAIDPDGTIPDLSTGSLPSGATFTDNGDGSGVFDWTPAYAHLGTHSVTFFATDDSLAVDSEAISIAVNVAGTQVVAVNGWHYTLDVGETVVSPQLQFAVADDEGSYFPNQWIYFSLVEGDGTISPDAVQSDGSGIATISYTFTDSLGHAVIRARAAGKDSVDVIVRRSCLIPGMDGQGQYLLLNEKYGMIKALNGLPDELIVHPTHFLFIADYEQSLGVVFVLEDIDEDEIAHDWEPILEIIVNDNEDSEPSNDYKGTTKDSIGIGSNISDVYLVYGEPDSIVADLSPPPPYWRYEWFSIGLTCYTDYEPDPADRFIHEIHLTNMSALSSCAAPISRLSTWLRIR